MNKILFLLPIVLLTGCKISLAWNGFSFGVDKSTTVWKNGSYISSRDFIGLDVKYAPDWTINEMVNWAVDGFKVTPEEGK